jgi:hypothetical protein
MTNDEQIAAGCVGARHRVGGGYSGQQQLERERIGRRHGNPWPHPSASFAQLQHREGTPRLPLQ